MTEENAARAATHPIPGKVCLVTGANTGIGAVTARELARAGGHVFLACRSAEKTEPVVRQIREETGNEKVEFLSLDLGSFASIRACARSSLQWAHPTRWARVLAARRSDRSPT